MRIVSAAFSQKASLIELIQRKEKFSFSPFFFGKDISKDCEKSKKNLFHSFQCIEYEMQLTWRYWGDVFHVWRNGHSRGQMVLTMISVEE